MHEAKMKASLKKHIGKYQEEAKTLSLTKCHPGSSEPSAPLGLALAPGLPWACLAVSARILPSVYRESPT